MNKAPLMRPLTPDEHTRAMELIGGNRSYAGWTPIGAEDLTADYIKDGFTRIWITPPTEKTDG